MAPRTGNDLCIVAGHAVNHFRSGVRKLADRGTGGLALFLAEEIGCRAIVVSRFAEADANFDNSHPVKEIIRNFRPKSILDIHGMADAPGRAEVELGLGSGPIFESFLEQIESSSLLKVAINQNFDARRATTITRYSQDLGLSAIQIEIAASVRLPTGSTERAATLLAELLRILSHYEPSNLG